MAYRTERVIVRVPEAGGRLSVDAGDRAQADALWTRAYARDFKQASVWDLRRYGFHLELAIEDDRRNVEMFRSEGVPCIYIHSGYYD